MPYFLNVEHAARFLLDSRSRPGLFSVVGALILVLLFVATAYTLSTIAFDPDINSKSLLSEQATLRSKLAQLLSVDDLMNQKDDNPIPFDFTEVTSRDLGDYTLKEIELNATSTRRFKLVITIPSTATGKLPAVIAVGGHKSDLYSVYGYNSKGESARLYKYKDFADKLARSGYITASTRVSQHEVQEPGRTLLGERLWDLMRTVDFIQSLAQADPDRIGVAGLSLGGQMAMWLGAMDSRIKVTISSGFLTTMAQLEQNHCPCWKVADLQQVADFSDIYSLIAPRALMCQNGLRERPTDFTVPLAQRAMKKIHSIYDTLGKPKNVVLLIHAGGHEIHVPSLLGFLDRRL